MNRTLRSAVAGVAALGLGVIAGPVIADAQTPPPVSGTLAEAGPQSVFVPIVAYRTLDTRTLDGKLDVDGDPFGFPASQIQTFADLNLDGDVAIPVEAIGITYNITVAQTEGTGFLSIGPANVGAGSRNGTSVVNWTEDGQQAANSGSVLMGTATDGDGSGSDYVEISIGGQSGARAHVLLDVTGYYVPAAP